MSGAVLLYGATGYTGRLLARRFKARNAVAGNTQVELVLGGRDPVRLQALREAIRDVRCVDFPLEDADEIDQALKGVDLVLNAAGPFGHTAIPLMDACVRRRVHYLDLSGEWRTFVEAMNRSAAAVAAGVMLMPGVGFTVVAGDCLMRHAFNQVKDAVSLRLACSWPSVVSAGTRATATTSLEPLALVRRDGELAGVPLGQVTRAFDFGRGLTNATLIGLPEVLTGAFTTGVRTIETYTEVTALQRLGFVGATAAMTSLGPGPVRQLAQSIAAAGAPEPSLEARKTARYDMVVETTDPWRRVRTFRMRTLDGYSVSLAVAPHIVGEVIGGAWRPGFQTPAGLLGCDFFFNNRPARRRVQLNCAELDTNRSFQGATTC
jgi:saccharopine dehydrogenase (NAD+, L-lysine-forming)